MRAVLTAWGRKTPVGRCGSDADDLDPGREGETNTMHRIARDWAQQDPAAALDFLKQRGTPGGSNIVAGVLSKGPLWNGFACSGTISAKRRSPRILNVGPNSSDRCLPARLPSSAEWQSLARETRNPRLAGTMRWRRWYRNSGMRKPTLRRRGQAWLAEIAPSGLRRRDQLAIGAGGDADDSSSLPWLRRTSRLGRVMGPGSSEPGPPGSGARILQRNGSAWMPSTASGCWAGLWTVGRVRMGRIGGPRNSTGAARGTRPRSGLGRACPTGRPRRSVGPAGGKAVLAWTGWRSGPWPPAGELSGESARQVPELFAQMSPEFQEERRMEVVARLASRSSPTAAELWLAPPLKSSPSRVPLRCRKDHGSLLARDPRGVDWIGRLPPVSAATGPCADDRDGSARRSRDVCSVGRDDRGSHRLATDDATPRRTCSSPSILTDQ